MRSATQPYCNTVEGPYREGPGTEVGLNLTFNNLSKA